MRPVVLDVHLVQSGLGGRVLHCDCPVQVVGDQRLGRFPRGHQDLACEGGGWGVRGWCEIVFTTKGQTVIPLRRLTGDFALPEGERDHHVERSKAAAIHAAPDWVVFVRGHLRKTQAER